MPLPSEAMRRIVVAGTVVLVALATACRSVAPTEAPRAAFERMAAETQYLDLQAVLYDRVEDSFRPANPEASAAQFRVLAETADPTRPKEALFELRRHKDPKVRTLAAVALFQREDPSVLPALVELADDDARTFDGHSELNVAWMRSTGIGPPPLVQSVGHVATSMVRMYLGPSGYGIDPPSEPGFREYWAARRNRTFCAGWFGVRLLRAVRGTSPTQPDCVERVRAVRRSIDALPADDRAWVLLALSEQSGGETLATEAEVVDACASLGPDKMLALLRRDVACDDPDLRPRARNNWTYEAMAKFVLRHASALLRPGDADALLECERHERDLENRGQEAAIVSPWWAVAAAHLAPTRASEILHAALGRFTDHYDDRTTLCVALWEVCGDAEAEFVADRAYSDVPDRYAFDVSPALYLRGLAACPNGRTILARIVRDERFDRLGWYAVQELLWTVNRWVDPPVVSDEEIRKASHPLGIGGFEKHEDSAEREYPKETADLRARLAEWRTRLRASVPQWAPRDGR